MSVGLDLGVLCAATGLALLVARVTPSRSTKFEGPGYGESAR
jgi:hypothetical protein